jgi:hypothetical protein
MEALIYSIENSPTQLAANCVGAISAALTRYLRNETSKYTGKR